MPIITMQRHGISSGCPPSRTLGKDSTKRSTIKGWSHDAIRRNTRFLRSIYEPDLTGYGYALTLTVRKCPPTYDEWLKLRDNFIKRLRRLDMIRMHWVTEWQRRGVPHLHCAVYFPHACNSDVLTSCWLAGLADVYDAIPYCQTVEPIYGFVGWSKYVSKHAARGLFHFQRSPDAVPRHWSKTGRMWGRIGSWPTCDPSKLELSRYGHWVYRRIVRRWRIADARSMKVQDSKDEKTRRRRIASARRMLKCSDRCLSSVRGTSEWIHADLQALIVIFLHSNGIECRYRNT